MLLRLDSLIIAQPSDGTINMRAQKPVLNLNPKSSSFSGMRYARNSANPSGLSYGFSVYVNRVFVDYASAESFVFTHFEDLIGLSQGILKYENSLGNLYGFDNATLENVEVVSEIGVSTEIRYDFRCGKPTSKFPYCVRLAGNLILAFESNAVAVTV